ncbi:hypothetical protein BGZ83_001819, partial [Gryganskiella cystojenkinii]
DICTTTPNPSCTRSQMPRKFVQRVRGLLVPEETLFLIPGDQIWTTFHAVLTIPMQDLGEPGVAGEGWSATGSEIDDTPITSDVTADV